MSFEVQIPKSESAAAPPIKARLEQSANRKVITIDDINKKLSHAAELRAAQREKHLTDVKESLSRVDQVCYRRTSEEKHKEERISAKNAIADEKRKVQLGCIADRAREYNKRVSYKVTLKNERLSQNASAKKQRTEAKLKRAAEIRQARFEHVK